MYRRFIEPLLLKSLQRSPAVVLLGPRQVGKTTLALQFKPAANTYLDLASDEDSSRLSNLEQYLRSQQSQLLILDEVQRMPQLFTALRGLIDSARRDGRKAGLYLLLGSASLDLIQHSSETLAGRITFIELGGLHRLELPPHLWDGAWLRGGFPDSLDAVDDDSSVQWRRDFIRTYLERDVLQFAPRIPAERLRRLWTMLAHLQGTVMNTAALARNLDVDGRTINSYIDLLVDLLLVRRLQPWHSNVGKRLVKSPKIYIRDSGLLHTLLGIRNMDALLSHPVIGASWEGHVLESLLAVCPANWTSQYYRSAAGAEVDLILTTASGTLLAIEIKRSTSPKLERGFYHACEDLQPAQRWLIHGGTASYPMLHDVQAMPLDVAMQRLAQLDD
jgi:predicted AAA+ superfamily ATPase